MAPPIPAVSLVRAPTLKGSKPTRALIRHYSPPAIVVAKKKRTTADETVQQFKSSTEFVGLYDVKRTLGKYVAKSDEVKRSRP